jgi:GST-like protein
LRLSGRQFGLEVGQGNDALVAVLVQQMRHLAGFAPAGGEDATFHDRQGGLELRVQLGPQAGELVGIANFPNVRRVLDAFVARPAVARGLEIPKRQG